MPDAAFAVVVPEGVSSGQAFRVVTPAGQTLQVDVPAGLRAGDEFVVTVDDLLPEVPVGARPSKADVGGETGIELAGVQSFQCQMMGRHMEGEIGGRNSSFMSVRQTGKLSLELAMRHGKNSMVERRRFGAKECPCGQCGFKDHGEPYSLNCHVKDLAPFGSGWVLFFDFARFVIALLIFYQIMYAGIAIYSRTEEHRTDRLGCMSQITYHAFQNETWASLSRCQKALHKETQKAAQRHDCEQFFKPSACTIWPTAGNWGPARDLFPTDGTELCSTSGGLRLETTMEYPWVMWNHYICLVVTLAAAALYRVRQVSLVLKASSRSVSASDYSVLLNNLPPDCRSELKIIRFVHDVLGQETYADDDTPTWLPHPEFDEDGYRPVVRVVLAFEVSSIAAKLTELQDAKAELKRLVLVAPGLEPDRLQAWQEETRQVRARFHALRSQVTAAMQRGLKVSGAFVTLRKPADAKLLLDSSRLGLPYWERFAHRVLPGCCAGALLPRRRWALGGCVVWATAPADPSDIIWESFGPSLCKKSVLVGVSAVMSMLVLGGSTIAMEKFTKWAKDPIGFVCRAYRRAGGKDSNLQHVRVFRLLTTSGPLVISLTVQVLNLVYPMLVEWLVDMWRPSTLTEKRCSEMWRITLFTIINTVFVGFYVHAQHVDLVGDGNCNQLGTLFPKSGGDTPGLALWGLPDWLPPRRSSSGLCADWYSDGHLVDDIFALVLSSIWLAPALVAIPPGLILAWGIRQWYTRGDLQTSKMTQRQLNQMFEGQPAELPYRYAHLLNMLTLAITFMPVVPIAPGLIAVGLVVFYAANKYFFLRHAKTPYTQSHLIGFTALDLIRVVVLPQPLLMALLLSPSVGHQDVMWGLRTLGIVVAALLLACVCYRGIARRTELRLARQIKPHAECVYGHKMTEVPVASFEQKFREHMTSAENLCGECYTELFGDHSKGNMLYHCEVCEGNGYLYELCDECGEEQRKGLQCKNENQPYEKAKNFFVYQYWRCSPIYEHFEDATTWTEEDIDEAFARERELEQLLQADIPEEEDRVASLEALFTMQAAQVGLEVVDEDALRSFAKEVVQGDARNIVLESPDDLLRLRAALDDKLRVRALDAAVEIHGVLLAPGWYVNDDELPDGQSWSGTVLVGLQRDPLTAAHALEQLQAQPWRALAPCSTGGRGGGTKRNSAVACDWDALLQDETFRKLHGSGATVCGLCSQDFGDPEALLEHFRETNHDIADGVWGLKEE